jgi:mono/diheme cytochrome c family protein
MGRTLAFGSVVAGLVLGTAPRAGAEGVSFNDTIWPILQERCISCHGGEKDKGGLKLDALDTFTAGGENGPVFVAGKPEESTLYKLVILPKDDPDIMPAKGDPLTEEQAKAIHTWIAEGANFGDWKGGAAPAAAAAAPVDVLEVLAQNTAPADAPLLEAVSALGGLAMPLDMKSPLVRVDYHLVGDTIGDEQLATLPPLAAQLTWLNLAGTKITDGGLATVAGLPKLTRLHLERTGITDAGVAQLCGLSNLEYLNLYGTQVTDAGLAKLAPLTNLKKIFLWQTPVTAEGAAALQAALPNLKIDRGIDPAAVPATEVAKVIPKEMFTTDSCCAKSAADNKVCDHPCCDEARKANTVCTKCNAGVEVLLAVVGKFDADGCCQKAFGGGKLCDHPCCAEAWAAKTACAKCNPKGTAPAPETTPAPTALKFDDGSCCAKAQAEGKDCDHPCCVEAKTAGTVCKKCNPKVV